MLFMLLSESLDEIRAIGTLFSHFRHCLVLWKLGIAFYFPEYCVDVGSVLVY